MADDLPFPSSPPAAPPVRHVPCPTCGRPAEFTRANRWRPFCTERCRQIDLGAWATGSYRVAAEDDSALPRDATPPAGG